MMATRPRVVVMGETTSPKPTPAAEDRIALDLAKAGRFLRRLAESGYFGKVTFTMQNGRFVDVKTEQTMKMTEIGDDDGDLG